MIKTVSTCDRCGDEWNNDLGITIGIAKDRKLWSPLTVIAPFEKQVDLCGNCRLVFNGWLVTGRKIGVVSTGSAEVSEKCGGSES